MSADGEESKVDVSDEIDTLLDELLPTSDGVADELPVWSVTEAATPLTPLSGSTASPESDPEASIEEPAGEPIAREMPAERPLAESQDSPSRRRGATPLLIGAAVLIAVVAVASLAGYWFGTRQSTEAAAPDTTAVASTTSVVSSSTAVASTAAVAETSTDDTSSAADASSSSATTEPEPPTSSEGLRPQLALAEIDTTPIGFEPGTDQLRPESMPVLLEVADALVLDATSEVEISVHTFSEETSGANHDLSHRQGDAVAAVLIEAGVSGNRLGVIGRGNEVPSANPDGEVVFRSIE